MPNKKNQKVKVQIFLDDAHHDEAMKEAAAKRAAMDRAVTEAAQRISANIGGSSAAAAASLAGAMSGLSGQIEEIMKAGQAAQIEQLKKRPVLPPPTTGRSNKTMTDDWQTYNPDRFLDRSPADSDAQFRKYTRRPLTKEEALKEKHEQRRRVQSWATSTDPIDYFIVPTLIAEKIKNGQYRAAHDGDIVQYLYLADGANLLAPFDDKAAPGEYDYDPPEAARILINQSVKFEPGDVVLEIEGRARMATVITVDPLLYYMNGTAAPPLYCARLILASYESDAAMLRHDMAITYCIIESAHWYFMTPVFFRGGDLTFELLGGDLTFELLESIKLNRGKGQRPQTADPKIKSPINKQKGSGA